MRKDDEGQKSYFRSADRVFHMNGSWYFATREGDHGPFANEQLAQSEIRRFIMEKTELAHFQKAREEEHSLALVEVDDESVETIELLPSRDLPREHEAPVVLSQREVYI